MTDDKKIYTWPVWSTFVLAIAAWSLSLAIIELATSISQLASSTRALANVQSKGSDR